MEQLKQQLLPVLFIAMISLFAVLKEKFRLDPEDVGVLEGESARLECLPPKGSPAPTVFWKKNGRIVDVETQSR